MRAAVIGSRRRAHLPRRFMHNNGFSYMDETKVEADVDVGFMKDGTDNSRSSSEKRTLPNSALLSKFVLQRLKSKFYVMNWSKK